MDKKETCDSCETCVTRYTHRGTHMSTWTLKHKEAQLRQSDKHTGDAHKGDQTQVEKPVG